MTIESVIAGALQKLSLSGENTEQLSTFVGEIQPKNFGDFTMDFLSGLDSLWLFNLQTTEEPVKLPPGNRLCF